MSTVAQEFESGALTAIATAIQANPALIEETRRALDELTHLLGLGDIYPFQQ